eukprot:scaffold90928_cov28-Tisochrysis_lutea.AAC.4
MLLRLLGAPKAHVHQPVAVLLHHLERLNASHDRALDGAFELEVPFVVLCIGVPMPKRIDYYRPQPKAARSRVPKPGALTAPNDCPVEEQGKEDVKTEPAKDGADKVVWHAVEEAGEAVREEGLLGLNAKIVRVIYRRGAERGD